jgi:release factor glutamine methyltransferase
MGLFAFTITMMDIRQILDWNKKELKNLENPSLESEVILSHVLHCDRTFLKSHSHKKLPLWKWIMNKKIVQKRKKRMPLAYIFGYKNWGDMRIIVHENVLIPRDETEILCHHILQKKRTFSPKRMLDIGTGSGNIALFLTRNYQSAKVIALDISHKALKIARKNVKLHHTKNIHLLHSHLLGSIEPIPMKYQIAL